MSTEYLLRINHEYAAYQPFVTPTAWALYAVYAAIITFSISKLQILQSSWDPDELLIAKHWMEVVDAALLPEDFKKIGTSLEYGLQWALKRLEDRIVDEMRNSASKAQEKVRQGRDGESSLFPPGSMVSIEKGKTGRVRYARSRR